MDDDRKRKAAELLAEDAIGQAIVAAAKRGAIEWIPGVECPICGFAGASRSLCPACGMRFVELIFEPKGE